MLGRDQHLLNRYRYYVAIPDGDLRLAVWPEEGQHPGFAHMRELPGQPMSEGDRHGHELRRLVRGVAEHHSLIPGTHAVESAVTEGHPGLVGHVDALGDVGRLPVQGDQDGTGIAVESAGRGVADLSYGPPDDLRDVQLRGRGDLARDESQA